MTQPIKDMFGTADYVVFGLMLLVSAAIGVYYAFVDRKKNSSQEFLMGGRSLSAFPVSLSILASFMSAVTLLGTPAEIYRFGTQYYLINIAFCFVVPVTAYLYVPVFYNLGITSAYEYLELRFNSCVRTIGAFVFTMNMIMYMPVVLYAPALALSEVTGIDIWPAVLSTGIICTFYTSIGGMKAVVWTDCFQSLMMYAAILVVVVKGAYDMGGMGVVWERNYMGDRIEFWRYELDPTVRHTIWSLVIGGYFTWIGTYAANQTMIQRYLTIKTLKGAQTALWINLPALLLMITLTSLSGMVIYAFYWDCDPIGTKIISAPDQLFPRFVMETLGDYPGLPGLFVAGIFSGSLSTISSGVNSLAAVALEDFIKKFMVKNLTEIWETRITKILAVSFGIISMALVSAAQELGGVLQAALTILGVVGGPMLGIFSLGMFIPFANNLGASTGLISGFVIAMWWGMGAFVKQPFNPEAPRSYENCTELYFNVTGTNYTTVTQEPVVIPNNDDILLPYRLSYLWLSAIGFSVVIIVGSLVSLMTGPKQLKDMDERLISPVILWLMQYLPGGKGKKVNLQEKQAISLSAFRNISYISDSELHPPKKSSVSYISDSKVS